MHNLPPGAATVAAAAITRLLEAAAVAAVAMWLRPLRAGVIDACKKVPAT